MPYRIDVTYPGGVKSFTSDDRDQAYQSAMAFMASYGNRLVSLAEKFIPPVITVESEQSMTYPVASNYNRSARRESEQAAREDGYELGRAFSGVFQLRRNPDMSSLVKLASKFAKLDGYGDMESGLQYVAGFQQGIQEGSTPLAALDDGNPSTGI